MEKDKLRMIADHYGIKKQLRQLAEECSELAVEASHSARKGLTVGIIEEIADVEIMIEQVKYLGRISEDDIQDVKEAKMERQLERMKEESNNG